LVVPFWWVDFGVRDLGGVELREINFQSMCFVVIIDREMTDNNIATGTYSITSKPEEGLARESQLTSLCPTREIIRATFRHPVPLAVSVNVIINNLCVDFGRVESHERVKCSGL
jgi:hypothetical protein